MDEFLEYQFWDHPHFHPKLLTHLFETMAAKTAIESYKAKIGVLELHSRDQADTIASLKRRLDCCESALNMKPPAGGDGGAAGGAAGARKRRGKKGGNQQAGAAGVAELE